MFFIKVDYIMKVMKDEIFGFVIFVMKVKSDEEVVELMNDSEFGFIVSIWIKDIDKGYELCEQVEVGIVFVNCCDFLSFVSQNVLCGVNVID